MPGTRRGLGRGLEALFPLGGPREGERLEQVEIDAIRPNPKQPRAEFDAASLEELAASMRAHGVLQPLIVRAVEGGYELVAGERRWRAARLAGLRTVPAVVRAVDDRRVAEIALIENLQREDLTPLEEARAYRELIDVHGLSQEEVAQAVGKSRSAVANALRLLALEEDLQQMVQRGDLTEGHARALLAAPAGAPRRALAARVRERGLTVREAEALARRAAQETGRETAAGGGGAAAPSRAQAARPSPDVAALARELSEVLGAPVRIREGARKGTIEIDFFDDEDLARVVELLRAAGSVAVPRETGR